MMTFVPKGLESSARNSSTKLDRGLPFAFGGGVFLSTLLGYVGYVFKYFSASPSESGCTYATMRFVSARLTLCIPVKKTNELRATGTS